MNWVKIAAVLSSNLFFVGSCTGITFLSAQPLKHIGGNYMSRGEAADPRMMVIASIPDPHRPGSRKLTHVFLGDLPEFQSAQPDHTFVIPPGEGMVSDIDSTSYRVKSLGEGRVEVETDFFHDVPFGSTIVARYEATEREVKPLYTNTPAPPWGVGLVGALILGFIGALMKWVQQRKAWAGGDAAG